MGLEKCHHCGATRYNKVMCQVSCLCGSCESNLIGQALKNATSEKEKKAAWLIGDYSPR